MWFYDMKDDGFSLDDKRNPITANDIPTIIEQWNTVEAGLDKAALAELIAARTSQGFLVPFAEIKANNWDLSINKYKETVHEEVTYDSIKSILADIQQLDAERAEALSKLEELLK